MERLEKYEKKLCFFFVWIFRRAEVFFPPTNTHRNQLRQTNSSFLSWCLKN